jgi:hypothetical protein
MIDSKALANELQQVRAARVAAEAAWYDVEELLWKVRQDPHIWRRMAFADAGADEAPPTLPH